MGYYIDLDNISIDDYKEMLKSADLIPSQMMLKENIHNIFNKIKKQKIENVEGLRQALRSKNKLQDFSKQSGISEDYLKILIRNVNSYRQKPNRIKDFPGVVEIAYNTVIGGITFKGPPSQAGEVEIGYGIAEAYQNNGYMTECLRALVRWALHQDGVTAVTAETAKENLPSEVVLRKNGFEHVRDTEEFRYWRIQAPTHHQRSGGN